MCIYALLLLQFSVGGFSIIASLHPPRYHLGKLKNKKKSTSLLASNQNELWDMCKVVYWLDLSGPWHLLQTAHRDVELIGRAPSNCKRNKKISIIIRALWLCTYHFECDVMSLRCLLVSRITIAVCCLIKTYLCNAL